MRYKLTILFIFFSVSTFAQNYNHSNSIIDCEALTNDAINSIVENYYTSEFDSLDIILDKLLYNCGIIECTQRIMILRDILESKSSSYAIETYFENKLYYRFQERIRSSNKIDFGYIYNDNRMYFGYVPLRHKIDSISRNIAIELLETSGLSKDERLVCILFSGDVETFYDLVDNREYKDTYISLFLKSYNRENYNSYFVYTIYAGAFSPIIPDNVFGVSPMLGVSMSSAFRNKLIVELAAKFRFNINDNSFKYYALNDTNTVNSEYSIFAGAIFSYKLFESEKLVILPKIGIGLEVLNTGISYQLNNNDYEYYDIETINFSLGTSFLTPVFKRHYIGFGINYHFCPYQLDKNLVSRINPNLVSTELFWRF